MDPNLLNPVTGSDPSLRVEALKGFTAPLGTTLVDEKKYYFSPVETNQFHRPDGKKIAFLFNFHETNIKQDQDYLDQEIRDGNMYVRYATADEIRAAHMRMNPKATMKAEVLTDPEVKAQIEAEVERRLQALLHGGVVKDNPIAGVDSRVVGEKHEMGDGTTLTVVSPASRLQGIGSTRSIGAAAAGSTSGQVAAGPGTATS